VSLASKPPTCRTRSLYVCPPSDRVAQLYPQAPGSLFVAFYGSRGYGGGILTRLRTGNRVCPSVTLCISRRRRKMANTKHVLLGVNEGICCRTHGFKSKSISFPPEENFVAVMKVYSNPVDVGDSADVSGVPDASMFTVEVCKVSLCRASSGLIRTMDQKIRMLQPTVFPRGRLASIGTSRSLRRGGGGGGIFYDAYPFKALSIVSTCSFY
jgi:hypothetical protein